MSVPNAPDRESGGGLTRVLVVEDEAMVSMLIEEMMTDLGCSVIGPAANSDDAAALIQEGEFDFAVLDVNLGGTDRAYGLADLLRERSIPYAFVTGYGSVGVEGPYRQVPVLRKPFDEESLIELVTQLTKKSVTV